MPKPFSRKTYYTYFGYIIAADKADAEDVFAEDNENKRKDYDEKEFQSFDKLERAVIAAEFNK